MSYLIRSSQLAVLVLLAAACSKSGQSGGASGPGPGPSATAGPTTGNNPPGLPMVPGQPDTTVKTGLPALPTLPHVTAVTSGDSVLISLEPVDAGRDYRVYVLPSDDAITAGADGALTIKDATYRCGGDRQTRSITTDGQKGGQSDYMNTRVEAEVDGYKRTMADATLGYVYAAPGAGRVPVYAMGDSEALGDNAVCYHQRWGTSRRKTYVTTEAQRTELLGKRYRDDGIVFYVPEAGAGTKPVYTKMGNGGGTPSTPMPVYYVDGAEADKRGKGSVAFNILSESAADTVALMRVNYVSGCGGDHDELTPGKSRFERARFQGDDKPTFDLHWSGITEETTLVVEALDVGCPFQGVLSPISRPAGEADGVMYPAYLTLEEARAAQPTGEVFVNGQHAATNKPRPIARSFIKVKPAPIPEMDWFAGFGPNEEQADYASFTYEEPCGSETGCSREFRQSSSLGDITFLSSTPDHFGMANVMGELWVTHADVGADVGAKFRMTPNTKGNMAADSYLHVTMEVDAATTARRYPQMLISDQEAPVQWGIDKGNTLIVQTISDDGTANWPFTYHLQVCDHRYWEVNDQCPYFDMYRLHQAGSDKLMGISAGPEIGEHTGVDRPTRFDAYLSTKRAYLFIDGQPHGCADLPEKGVPSGPVTITFGDVLYHSGVDEVFGFHEKHQKVFSKRHFDNLGFKSDVEGPMWDEKRFPCFAANTLHP